MYRVIGWLRDYHNVPVSTVLGVLSNKLFYGIQEGKKRYAVLTLGLVSTTIISK